MTNKQFTHDCFKCKHCDWKFRDDVPIHIHEYVICKLGHEQTSYNTKFTEDFICNDYQHSYFIKTYWGYWFYGILITLILICIIKIILTSLGAIQ